MSYWSDTKLVSTICSFLLLILDVLLDPICSFLILFIPGICLSISNQCPIEEMTVLHYRMWSSENPLTVNSSCFGVLTQGKATAIDQFLSGSTHGSGQQQYQSSMVTCNGLLIGP